MLPPPFPSPNPPPPPNPQSPTPAPCILISLLSSLTFLCLNSPPRSVCAWPLTLAVSFPPVLWWKISDRLWLCGRIRGGVYIEVSRRSFLLDMCMFFLLNYICSCVFFFKHLSGLCISPSRFCWNWTTMISWCLSSSSLLKQTTIAHTIYFLSLKEVCEKCLCFGSMLSIWKGKEQG